MLFPLLGACACMLRCRLGWFAVVVVVAFSKSGDVFIFFFFFTSPFSLYSTTVCYFVLLVFSLSLNCFVFFLFVCLALFSSRRLSCYIAGFHGLTLPHVGCSVFFFFSCFPVVSVCVWKKKKITTTRDKLAAPSSFFFFFPPPPPGGVVSMYLRSNPNIRGGENRTWAG